MGNEKEDWRREIEALGDVELRHLAEARIPENLSFAHDFAQRDRIEYARALAKQRDVDAEERDRSARAEREKESLTVAREANRIATGANQIADRARTIAIAAAILAGVTFLVAVVGLFTKS